MYKNTVGFITNHVLGWKLLHRFHKHVVRAGTAVRIPTTSEETFCKSWPSCIHEARRHIPDTQGQVCVNFIAYSKYFFVFTHIITSWGVLSQFPSGIIFLKPEKNLTSISFIAMMTSLSFCIFISLYLYSVMIFSLGIEFKIGRYGLSPPPACCCVIFWLLLFLWRSQPFSVICCHFEDHVTFISGAFKILSFSWKQFHIF